MRIALQLRHSSVPVTEPARAWFIPGSTAEDWLLALLGFGIDLRTVVLLPVPGSQALRQPLGVVAVLPAGVTPHRVVRARPWQLRIERVLLPMDAVLWPPLEDAELRELLLTPWLVWHPTAGPVALAAEDVLCAAHLFAVRTEDRSWMLARPGVAAIARLVAVAPDFEVELGSMFAAESSEIGSEPVGELPPLPNEPPVARRKFREGVAGSVARGLDWVRGLLERAGLPASGGVLPGWLARLGRWIEAQRQPARASANEQKRQLELQRLLVMLRDDPDRGLKHALPLGGASGRGTATPGNKLGTRDTTFRLGGLGGGGAVDAWNMSFQMRTDLERRYRELATAEIAAGNHRRAAYILAQLLGDLRSAANVLRDGKFYREAAVLFRDRLNDLDAASACLLGGGLLVEAAELEEVLERFERAGDLRLILGQEDASTSLYRRAHAELKGRGHAVSAALLRAEKLCDVDGAVLELEDRWQGSGEMLAFAAWLGLLQRVGREEQILRHLREVSAGREMSFEEPPAYVLGFFVRRVSPGPLRDLLRDLIRRVVAATIRRTTSDWRSRLFEAMRRASPDDQVLPADTRRLAMKLREPQQGPARQGVVQLRRLWQSLGGNQPPPRLAVVGPWLVFVANGAMPEIVRRAAGERVWRNEPVAALRVGERVRGVQPLRDGAVLCWSGRRGGAGDQLDRVNVLLWPPKVEFVTSIDEALAVAADDNLHLWVVRRTAVGCLEVRSYTQNGAWLGSEMPDLGVFESVESCHACAFLGQLVVAVGRRLLVRAVNGAWASYPLDSEVTALVRSEEAGNPLVLVGQQRGFRVLDAKVIGGGRLAPYAEELEAPTVGWTRNGLLLAVDEHQALLFRRRDALLVFVSRAPFRSGKPLAIVPTPALDEVLFVAPQTLTCFAVR